MLVLRRSRGQSLILECPDGTRMRVMVVRADASVCIGIDAPRHIRVMRAEIADESLRSMDPANDRRPSSHG
jgi:sRNA-binding carbon storage regulator CsrA